MPVDRPTFSESWYRVAALRPRLRATVQAHRQHFRGEMWHVLQDPSTSDFFRLNAAAYQFVAMLDGRRTVADVWKVCNEQLGDSAPTQGEAIQLLGRLYAANLLQADLSPDSESLLKRYRQRVRREVQGFLTNLLFVRIPLLDPDRFLDRWVGVFGRVFTWYGFVVWLGLILMGLYFVAGRTDDLVRRASGVLDRDNLLFLYVGFALVKVFHEFGHAFACKKFGREAGTRGEVHVMGLMLLVLTPMPYVDASSAWMLRGKWRRALVGAAGMLVELAIAAIAAAVWAGTSEGTVAHAIAYNVMFVASVSTLLFNGNPLLRYDGYYILSDLVEIPNLQQRSRQYLYYLVKRYVWAVRNPQSPAHTPGERVWMVFYGLASTVYRVFICTAILLFVADKLFILGAVLAVAALVAWVLVPLGRFLHYLLAGSELARVRFRAVGTTLLAAGAVAAAVGLVRIPDRCRVEGVVEPERLAVVHAATDGFVERFQPSGRQVTPEGEPLVQARNEDLVARRAGLEAERRSAAARRDLARASNELAQAAIFEGQIAVLGDQIARVDEQLADLALRAPVAGEWISPDIERVRGAYLRRGDRVGLVATVDRPLIRATAGQQVAALLIQEGTPNVDIRVEGRPDLETRGLRRRILPAGQEHLPSAALGFSAGGSMEVVPDDRSGTRAAERFFEIEVELAAGGPVRLLPGQRVVVRFELSEKPLALQAWRWLLQLVQRRFHI